VRLRVDTCAVAVLLLAVTTTARAQPVRTSANPKSDDAPRLAEVLQSLQARGLRIVFSSNIVTPDMRVRLEPRTRTPRHQLDAILAPHGLVARDGPGGILQIVRAPSRPELPSSPIPPPDSHAGTTMLVPLPTYKERITVTSPLPWWEPIAGLAEESVTRRELTLMPAGLVDDPVLAVQAMPRVAPVNDYRSEFVVRASPFRHAEVVIDGVSTSWLRHAPSESASVSMFTTALVESATLRAGAYARTYGDRLGPQLELTLREGARDRVHVNGTVSNAAATIIAEGPLSGARGSWIAAARQSLLEWPAEDLGPAVPAFGFSDGLAKIVFDAGARHQLGFSLLAGRSLVDADEEVETGPLSPPAARTSVANLSWRSMLGSTGVLTQRAYLIRRHIANQSGDEDMVYRASLVTKTPLGVLQSGAQVGRTIRQHGDGPESAWTRSGFLNLQARAGRRLTVSPGVRISGASHAADTAVSPWLLGELGLGLWTIAASTGISHQFAERARPNGVFATERLQTERAFHADVTVRRQVTRAVQVEATIYRRREQGVFDRIDGLLEGSARGIELVIERRSSGGLSGWGAYTYGRASYTDAARGETFPADFDQRHAVTAFASYRWRDSTSVGATVRLGTAVPIPGYLSSRRGNLFIGDRRNNVRLSTYSRFDLRADRAFRFAGRRLQAFVEVVNLFDSANAAATRGAFGPGGEAIGFVERLTPRRFAAGVSVGF
jgi:hypothetical protein